MLLGQRAQGPIVIATYHACKAGCSICGAASPCAERLPACLHCLQVEACDCLNGIVLLQSMAGGTGAGFGTFVAQALRDEYSSAFMFNACVW